jgi:hypothetical protein
MRTFKSNYNERIYRASVTGLDEEIRYHQNFLVATREASREVGMRLRAPATLKRLGALHRKRNKLMRVTNAT